MSFKLCRIHLLLFLLSVCYYRECIQERLLQTESIEKRIVTGKGYIVIFFLSKIHVSPPAFLNLIHGVSTCYVMYPRNFNPLILKECYIAQVSKVVPPQKTQRKGLYFAFVTCFFPITLFGFIKISCSFFLFVFNKTYFFCILAVLAQNSKGTVHHFY